MPGETELAKGMPLPVWQDPSVKFSHQEIPGYHEDYPMDIFADEPNPISPTDKLILSSIAGVDGGPPLLYYVTRFAEILTLNIPSTESLLAASGSTGRVSPETTPNMCYHTKIIASVGEVNISIIDGGNPSEYGANGTAGTINPSITPTGLIEDGYNKSEELTIATATYDHDGALTSVFCGWDKEFGAKLKEDNALAEVTDDLTEAQIDEQIDELINGLIKHMNLIAEFDVTKLDTGYRIEMELMPSLYPEEEVEASRKEIILAEGETIREITFSTHGKTDMYEFKIENGILSVLTKRGIVTQEGVFRETGQRKLITLPLQIKKAAVDALVNADLRPGDDPDKLFWAGFSWEEIVNVKYDRNLGI